MSASMDADINALCAAFRLGGPMALETALFEMFNPGCLGEDRRNIILVATQGQEMKRIREMVMLRVAMEDTDAWARRR